MLAVAVWFGFSVCIVRSPASPVLSLCAGGGRFAELAARTFSRLHCLPGLNTALEHLPPGGRQQWPPGGCPEEGAASLPTCQLCGPFVGAWIALNHRARGPSVSLAPWRRQGRLGPSQTSSSQTCGPLSGLPMVRDSGWWGCVRGRQHSARSGHCRRLTSCHF